MTMFAESLALNGITFASNAGEIALMGFTYDQLVLSADISKWQWQHRGGSSADKYEQSILVRATMIDQFVSNSGIAEQIISHHDREIAVRAMLMERDIGQISVMVEGMSVKPALKNI